jgi:signal transduction histidine kinase
MIGRVVATPDAPRTVQLPRMSGRVGLGALTVFLVIGLATRITHDPVPALGGALLAFAAGLPLFLLRPRFLLLYAGATTAGVVLVNANARDIGWFAVCVLGSWCMLVGGVRIGTFYWAGSVLLFGAEWLISVRDPGWGAWTAGTTFTALAAALVRHELVLVARLHAAQAGLAERSRVEERNRIARELHDVIAHSLTVSLLHVSSARLAVEHDDPADAVQALAEAERLGRQSLAEVRATMGLPQPGTGIAPPVPRLGDLARLVEQVRDAGVDVSLAIDGDAGAVSATTGSTVYRIVQEALTNATKHAPGSRVVVRTGIRRGRVEVYVDSAGLPGHGSGMGLMSMSARAEAVGGTCTAGPGGSGWLVHAFLPLRAEPGVGAT